MREPAHHLTWPPPLWPAGRLEFAAYLPANCQAALIQPVGSQGVLVVGSDTQRGFTRLDQVRVLWAGQARFVLPPESCINRGPAHTVLLAPAGLGV